MLGNYLGAEVWKCTAEVKLGYNCSIVTLTVCAIQIFSINAHCEWFTLFHRLHLNQLSIEIKSLWFYIFSGRLQYELGRMQKYRMI